jgi:hypothetical protein
MKSNNNCFYNSFATLFIKIIKFNIFLDKSIFFVFYKSNIMSFHISKEVLQRALTVNGLLLVYYCCENVSAFLGIVILATIFIVPKPYDFFG